MTSISANKYLLPWESQSLFGKFKERILPTSPSVRILLNALKTFDIKNIESTWSPLHKAVAYLSEHSHKTLYKATENMLMAAEPIHREAALQSLTLTSLSSGRLKMLDTCQKIISLDALKVLSGIANPLESAKMEAAITPKQNKESLMASSSRRNYINLGMMGKIAHYFAKTVGWSYSIDLETPPDNRWSAQSQMTFFRMLLDDAKTVVAASFALFATTWKVVLVAGGVIASVIGLKYLYHKLHLDTPSAFNSNYFRNLNQEAERGRLYKTVGRRDDILRIEACLSPPPGQKARIPILVGPPGVGKTQLMEGLAQRIVSGEAGKLKNKKVLAVNTASLQDMGGFSESGYANRAELLFKMLDGYEDRIILFFDEIHNAAGSKFNDSPPLLESLKTKLMEKNVLCVLATTTEEYDLHIASNKAFQDRTKRIDIGSLGDTETKVLLQERFGSNGSVQIDAHTYDTVLQLAAEQPDLCERANPRKSVDLLQGAVNFVYSWRPTKLDHNIEQLEIAEKNLLSECCLAREEKPGWIHTDAGKIALEKQKHLQQQLELIKTQKAAQTALYQHILFLNALTLKTLKRSNALIHVLAAKGGKDTAQKQYLFVQHVLLPMLRASVHQALDTLEKDFQEKMPLKVDADVIKNMC